MVCPKCQSENTSIRESKQLKEVRRRRYQCLNCGWRFTTHEIPVSRVYKNQLPRVYVSDDGSWVSSNLVNTVAEQDS